LHIRAAASGSPTKAAKGHHSLNTHSYRAHAPTKRRGLTGSIACATASRFVRRATAYFHRYIWETIAITIARSPAGSLPRAVMLLDGAGFEGLSCFAAAVFLYRFLYVGLHFPQIA
jgi:hypothetical protein